MKLAIPAYLEIDEDYFVASEEATVKQWRDQKRLAKNGGRDDAQRRAINALVRLADKFGLDDNVVLVPRLSIMGVFGPRVSEKPGLHT